MSLMGEDSQLSERCGGHQIGMVVTEGTVIAARGVTIIRECDSPE